MFATAVDGTPPPSAGGETLGADLKANGASVALTSAASLATDHASYVFPS